MNSSINTLKSYQVFTPALLARAMVDAVSQSSPGSWLEPSMGTGVFVEAVDSLEGKESNVVGLELDEKLRPPGPSRKGLSYGVEALSWMAATRSSFDAVVGNPPYISLSDVDSDVLKAARDIIDLQGNNVRIGSNLWAAFVLASLRVLNPGGSLAFVLPAAWDYADYAHVIRSLLPLKFETFHVFRSAKPMFRDVSDGSVVILGTGFGKRHRYFARIQCADVSAVCDALRDFRISSRSFEVSEPVAPEPGSGLQLGDFLKIRLGGVTGDSKFFTLSEGQRKELGLPVAACRKIISRSRHMLWPSIGRAEWEALRDNNQKVWLFRPSDSLAASSAVRSYLDLPFESGGCDRSRFKVLNRDPWFRTPLPTQVDAFISGMTNQGPKIVFNDLPKLTATNTLYVVTFAKFLRPGQRRNVAQQLFGDMVKEQLLTRQRTYAGGMKKLEPSDLLRLRIEDPVRNVGVREYAKAFFSSGS